MGFKNRKRSLHRVDFQAVENSRHIYGTCSFPKSLQLVVFSAAAPRLEGLCDEMEKIAFGYRVSAAVRLNIKR